MINKKMIKHIDTRLYLENYVIEFDGTHYAMPMNLFTSEQWGELILLVLPSLTEKQLIEILETSESLEDGQLEPDMITEEIAFGEDYLMVTPISTDVIYVEHESKQGNTIGYQLENMFSLDSLLIWLGEFPKETLDSVFTYIESINSNYTNDFTL